MKKIIFDDFQKAKKPVRARRKVSLEGKNEEGLALTWFLAILTIQI